MKYFTFGMKTLRITQSYNGTLSHKPHWFNSKDYADYPIDVAGKDGNREPYYATVDMQVLAIKGKGYSMTNTIWLVTTDKVQTPSGAMKVFMALTHWNDNDPYISKLTVGSLVKAGEPICEEGMDGATANHLHVVYGNADRGCGSSLIQNTNGKWVSSGYCMKPEEIMFINKSFTKVENTSDINFSMIDIVAQKEDSSDTIDKIDNFLAQKVIGNYYGDYTESVVSIYKKKKGLKNTDGSFIDSETLELMKQDGLEL